MPPFASWDASSQFRIVRAALQFGWGPCRSALKAVRHHGAVQRVPELTGLVATVKNSRPKVIVEVGTRFGGTFSCWPDVATHDALIVSIDLPSGSFGGGSGDEIVSKLQTFLKPGQRFEWIRQDSHLPETKAWLTNVLDERPIDFLFLDGDHSLAGITQDFETFTPLVAPGGLVAFHDIIPDPTNDHIQVPQFWRQLREQYESTEFIDPPRRTEGGMGIGVIKTSAGPRLIPPSASQ